MDTKLKGDIAEQSVILKCLKLGYDVLTPIGDRLPYDLVIVNNSKFIKQVKSAWYDENSKNYIVDSRKGRTNRKFCRHEKYCNDDFDFAILFIQDLELFYVMPSDIFNQYGASISLVVSDKRQRKPKSDTYKEAWYLINNFN